MTFPTGPQNLLSLHFGHHDRKLMCGLRYAQRHHGSRATTEAMSTGISFGLGAGLKKANQAPVRKPVLNAFGGGRGGDSDDGEEDDDGFSSFAAKDKGKGKATNGSALGSLKGKSGGGNTGLLKAPTGGSGGLSRQERLKQEAAKKLDATVFEYDEVYDDMKEAEREAKATKDALGQDRKVSAPPLLRRS